MIVRPEEYGARITPAVVRGALQEFMRGAERRKKLHDYYLGDHDITRRVKKNKKASNHKIVTNRAAYIVKIASAYLVGSPVNYTSKEQEEALNGINAAYQRTNVETVDAELARNASEFGRAVELLYTSAASEPRTASLDPRVAFVVYDDTVAHEPMFGVHIVDKRDVEGRIAGLDIRVYTASEMRRYTMAHAGGMKNIADWSAIQLQEDPAEKAAHIFGGVPMVEYWNNAEERGDFEDVLSLIDAYNLLLSDRVNDKEQFVNALLVLMGIQLGTDKEEANRNFREISEDGYLEIPSIAQGADVKFVVKQLNEADTKILADALVEDIHTISMVPNLTDAHFAGATSGVAFRYKLFAFEQLTKDKERWFKEGLELRLKMFATYLAGQRKIPANFDTDKVQMAFARGLPVNELEIAQTLSLLQGILPDEQLLPIWPGVDNVQETIAMKEEQRQAEQTRDAVAWGERVRQTQQAQEDKGA